MAVVAGGVDIVYPAENADLYARTVDVGAVVSEQPFGLKPQGRHFPRRNRIISGLALGVVVVEASLRSGTLITARLAGEQGRKVFAVPSAPLDPRHRGTNRLIRDGAALTEGANDVIEFFPRFGGISLTSRTAGLAAAKSPAFPRPIRCRKQRANVSSMHSARRRSVLTNSCANAT